MGYWFQLASQSLQMPSSVLKDSLQKAHGKLKDCNSDVTPVDPLPRLSTHSANPVNCFSTLNRRHSCKQKSSQADGLTDNSIPTFKRGPHMGLLPELMKTRDSLVNCCITPLTRQGVTPVNTRACAGDPGKTGRSQ